MLKRTIKSYPDTDNVEVNTVYSYFKKIVNTYLQPDDRLASLLRKYRKNSNFEDLKEIINNLSAITFKNEMFLFDEVLEEGRKNIQKVRCGIKTILKNS